MERLPRGIYSPELRDQAVRLYQEEQTTLSNGLENFPQKSVE
jgi:transposase-like protein